MNGDRIAQCLNIADLRDAARRRAHPMVFDYIDGGSDDEHTLRRNSAAFADFELHYRVLAGAAPVNCSTTILGQPVAMPYIASPAAGNRLFHVAGETAVARAAAEAGIIYCLSTLSSTSIEDIAAASRGPKWFQLYVWRDRSLVREMLQRARDAGFRALILTVDFPIAGNRERDPRNGFVIPPRTGFRQAWWALRRPFWTTDYLRSPPIRYANLSGSQPASSLADFVARQLDATFDWDGAEWLLAEWNGPAVIKGVVRADDARRAASTGFNAIMVSNHGGRQLDHAPAPIDVLERIVDTVGSDAEIILDGGIRRGTDVLKALALGARAVSGARPYLYGLAANGEAGARRAFQIIADSLRRDMVLLGTREVSEIDRVLVSRRSPIHRHQ